MSIGTSGRIVIEVPPETKRELYATLARDGLSLKEWFLRHALDYMSHSCQKKLDLAAHGDSSALDSSIGRF